VRLGDRLRRLCRGRAARDRAGGGGGPVLPGGDRGSPPGRATFVEGVASVALASVRTRIGDVSAAADGFGHLIDFWRRTGQITQLWTTARNAAGLLSTVGRSRTAALLLPLSADAAPGAAAVGPEIARFSGRAFTPVDELVAGADLAELRAEAVRLGAGVVLDRAVWELQELAEATA
jgi:hypothetical protein